MFFLAAITVQRPTPPRGPKLIDEVPYRLVIDTTAAGGSSHVESRLFLRIKPAKDDHLPVGEFRIVDAKVKRGEYAFRAAMLVLGSFDFPPGGFPKVDVTGPNGSMMIPFLAWFFPLAAKDATIFPMDRLAIDRGIVLTGRGYVARTLDEIRHITWDADLTAPAKQLGSLHVMSAFLVKDLSLVEGEGSFKAPDGTVTFTVTRIEHRN